MAGKVSSKVQEGHYSSYKTNRRWEKNRTRKLEAALKRNPENEQIKKALQNIKYRRKTPTNREWSATQIMIAKLFKAFIGKFDKGIFSTNEKTAAAAMAGLKNNFGKVKNEKVDFSIAARIKGSSA